TCSKQPLTFSILQALQGALRTDERIINRTKLLREAEKLLDSRGTATEHAVFDLILKLNTAVVASSLKGLLIIIDELGKFLEFAATSAETQDVFLLQRIAEFA